MRGSPEVWTRPGWAVRPRWAGRRPPWPLRVAAVVFLALIQVLGTHGAAFRQPEARPLDALAATLLVAGPALLLAVPRRPGPAAAAVVGVTLVYFALGYPWGPVLASPVFALVVATAAGARRWGWGAGGAMAVAAAVWALPGGDWLRAGAVAAWIAVVLLIGEGLRVRRERIAARRREWESHRREVRDQERLELARDIHDIVAHSLSLINVRASVALHLAERKPEELVPALEAIKHASHEALGEVRELLGVLRQDAPVTPEDPLGRIPGLIEDARGTGLAVALDARLDPPPSPAIQRVVHRVVQEALTNAVRHAGARRVEVRIAREGGRVVVDVHDDGSGLRGSAPGAGLTGMRERVESLGGTLALTDDGGLRVRAELPEGQDGAAR
ncbi:two-component sensor histidine kinase [Sinomonas cyclohexanicum]|uniref:histidine kinase n=1 Tax=Sinomonas cyclohexanicum TaxID=322009 RepID=A0ABN6FEK2_SINCY|nr:sensor histidine kinase [Corynebacterium cyclohexanicum]BCT75344.1 two-component sensor histidine kinase [Corynebacterium cyclohexanicum]